MVNGVQAGRFGQPTQRFVRSQQVQVERQQDTGDSQRRARVLKDLQERRRDAIETRDNIRRQKQERIDKKLGGDTGLNRAEVLEVERLRAVDRLISEVNRGGVLREGQVQTFISQSVSSAQRGFLGTGGPSNIERARRQRQSVEQRALQLGAVGQTTGGDFILPSGRIVTADVISRTSTPFARPTRTEIGLRQSLPKDIRGQPVEFVRGKQSIAPVIFQEERAVLDIERRSTEANITGRTSTPTVLLEDRQERISTLKTKSLRGNITPKENIELFALGGITSIKGFVESLKRPKETAEAIFITTPQKIFSGEGFPEIGELARTQPVFFSGQVFGELALAKGIGKFAKFTAETVPGGLAKTGITGRVFPIETDVLGRKTIRGVPGETFKEFDIGLVPPGNNPVLVSSLSGLQVIEELGSKIPLRKNPKLPPVKGLQKDILQIAKDRGEPIGGSFSQQALLESKFARPFRDLDIDARNQVGFVNEVKRRLGNKVIIKEEFKGPNKNIRVFKIIDKKTKKTIADVVPFAQSEEGLAGLFPTINVQGVKLIDPRARLGAKARVVALQGKRGKQIRDLELLTGKSLGLEIDPRIKGAFGFTAEQQAIFRKAKGPDVTAARGLVPVIAAPFRKIIIKPELPLFFSPPGPKILTKGGRPITFFRPSRLPLVTKEASFLDLVSGDISLKRTRPQIVIREARTKTKTTLSSELEEFISSGILKQTASPGVTVVEGRRVPIKIVTEAGDINKAAKANVLGKLSPGTKSDLNKFISSQLTQEKDIINLQRNFRKESGIEIDLLSSTRQTPKAFVSPTRLASVIRTRRKELDITSLSITPPRSPGISRPISVRPSAPISLPVSTPPSIPRDISRIPRVPVSGRSGISRNGGGTTGGSGISRLKDFKTFEKKLIIPSLKKKKKKEEDVFGFRTFVLKEGEKVFLEGLRPRGQALRRGAEEAERTLRATFGIQKTSKRVTKALSGFTPDQTKFRAFRRRKGQKIPLVETFIERRKFRLDTPSEIREITKARRSK